MNDVSSNMLLSVTQSVGMFTTMLPHLSDVRHSDGNVQIMNDVRMGEVTAFALCTGIGLTASILAHSPAPVMVSIAVGVGMIALYESVLQTPPIETRVAS